MLGVASEALEKPRPPAPVVDELPPAAVQEPHVDSRGTRSATSLPCWKMEPYGTNIDKRKAKQRIKHYETKGRR